MSPCKGCGKNRNSRIIEAAKQAGMPVTELGPFKDHVPAQPVEPAGDTVESSSDES